MAATSRFARLAMGPRCHPLPTLCLGLTIVGAAVLGQPAVAAPLSAGAVGEHLGFSAEDERKFEAGEIVYSEIEEATDKQLAIAIAMLVQADVDQLVATILDNSRMATDPGVLDAGGLDPANPDASTFAEVTFTPEEVGEIEALLNVEPGSDFNLSTVEIERFQTLAAQHDAPQASDPAIAEAVTTAYREVLAERFQAYLAEGLAGIAPYDRGGELSSATDDLEAAAAAPTLRLVAEGFPDLYRAFVNYPNDALDDVEHAFAWIKLGAEGRPIFVLDHTMIQHRADAMILLERVFYVGHSFNASQVFAAALPIDEGLAVLYTNRTASDQLAGFMSGVRHKIGRGMMRDALIELFESFRAQLDE